MEEPTDAYRDALKPVLAAFAKGVGQGGAGFVGSAGAETSALGVRSIIGITLIRASVSRT